MGSPQRRRRQACGRQPGKSSVCTCGEVSKRALSSSDQPAVARAGADDGGARRFGARVWPIRPAPIGQTRGACLLSTSVLTASRDLARFVYLFSAETCPAHASVQGRDKCQGMIASIGWRCGRVFKQSILKLKPKKTPVEDPNISEH